MKAEILRTEGTMIELLNPFMIDEFKRASSVLVDYNLPEEVENLLYTLFYEKECVLPENPFHKAIFVRLMGEAKLITIENGKCKFVESIDNISTNQRMKTLQSLLNCRDALKDSINKIYPTVFEQYKLEKINEYSFISRNVKLDENKEISEIVIVQFLDENKQRIKDVNKDTKNIADVLFIKHTVVDNKVIYERATKVYTLWNYLKFCGPVDWNFIKHDWIFLRKKEDKLKIKTLLDLVKNYDNNYINTREL